MGAREFPIPMAKIYSTNLTADKETGLGSWSDQQLRDAITRGIRPNGEKLLPVMPYEAYSGMSEEDLKALIAYLKTLKPVKKATPELESRAPLTRSLGIPTYLKIFGCFSNSPAQAPKSGIGRGQNLVGHVSLFRDRHTSRQFIGAPNWSLFFAGETIRLGAEFFREYFLTGIFSGAPLSNRAEAASWNGNRFWQPCFSSVVC